MSKVTIILAQNNYGIIGKDNDLPWPKNKADMKHFIEVTREKVVVMGRKTAESLGRPLPNRVNVVLTRNENFKLDGFITETNIELIKDTFNRYVIIGGSEIYELFKFIADEILISTIDDDTKEGVTHPFTEEFINSLDPNLYYINQHNKNDTLDAYLTALGLTPEEINNTTLKKIDIIIKK